MATRCPAIVTSGSGLKAVANVTVYLLTQALSFVEVKLYLRAMIARFARYWLANKVFNDMHQVH